MKMRTRGAMSAAMISASILTTTALYAVMCAGTRVMAALCQVHQLHEIFKSQQTRS